MQRDVLEKMRRVLGPEHPITIAGLQNLGGTIMDDVSLPPLPDEVREARESRELPAEALTLYSRALFFQDRGQEERAIELFRRVQTEFPEMTEATDALVQLGQT